MASEERLVVNIGCSWVFFVLLICVGAGFLALHFLAKVW